jgi:hypothetical protein
MIALNVEWLGMGQLSGANYNHYRMNQLDLCGTSGVAPFYLSMKRAIDVLVSLEHADPGRVAVAGLSGGGWQTIVIGALDPRVTLANPVAGYSGFKTRARHHSDLGDSEQTPSDMAAVADYLHLTAMRAPRPTLLTYNVKDECCFKADHALPPLIEAARPIFALYGKADHLRSHVNHDPGTHNFLLDNRQQLYRMLGDFFYGGDTNYSAEEIPCEDEVKPREALDVVVPQPNADFHSLALSLCQDLPRGGSLPAGLEEATAWQRERRSAVEELVRARSYAVEAAMAGTRTLEGGSATYWWLRIGGTWTVPAVEIVRGSPTSTTVLLADGGREGLADTALAHLECGRRVLAVDPFYLGESKISSRDFLFALLVASVGDRPLGIQASQLASIARWAQGRWGGAPVALHAAGPRTALASLVAASLETEAIGELTLRDSLGSLREVIERNLAVNDAPELFCIGLLEQFDMRHLTALVAPRPVRFEMPSERVRREMADMQSWYALLGKEFDPLQ